MMLGNRLAYTGTISGVVCGAAASGRWGMSGFSDTVLVMYAPISREISVPGFRFMPLSESVIKDVTMNGKFFITTPFQTLMDMVEYGTDVEIVCQSILWWEDKYGNLDEIVAGFKDRGLYKEYCEWYEPYLEDSRFKGHV
jgi:hypothetical protein